MRGCTHKERPVQKLCTNCGSEICYECVFEDALSARVTAVTSVDPEVRNDYGFFCAACYLERIRDDEKRKLVLEYDKEPFWVLLLNIRFLQYAVCSL